MKWKISIAALLLGASLTGTAAMAAAPANPPGGNIYDWPNLGQGMWAAEMVNFGAPNKKRTPIPLTPAAAAARAAKLAKVTGSATCNPVGPLGLIGAGYPLKFYFTPGEIVMMTDMDALWVRHIYMDGLQHHDDGPSYEGYSAGHWEGNTLVVETTELSDKVNLTSGVPATPTSHLEERYTLLTPKTMILKVTITDPAVLTAPYSFTQNYVEHKDWEIEDTFCGEGNRDAPGDDGDTKVDLTPPTS